jgi:CBS domain containing-hemolysin-like protein
MQHSWATSSIGDRPRKILSVFQAGLTVDLIATSRDLFETCSTNDSVKSVIDRNRQKSFDFLPVLDSSSGGIVGLIEIAPVVAHAKSHVRVAEAMQLLSEGNLLGADASIVAFVRNADEQRCRLIISQNEISGLVSLSDLQRLPASSGWRKTTSTSLCGSSSVNTRLR